MSRTYKQLAAHNSVCNEVYYELQDCQKEHPIRQFLGKCTSFEKKVDKCIRANLERKRSNNAKLSNERKERLKQSLGEQQ